MFDFIREKLAKFASLKYVRSSLLFFTACFCIIAYEFHSAVRDLPNTGVMGLVPVLTLSGLMALILVSVTRLTAQCPTHLVHEFQTLKEVIESKDGLENLVGELVDKRLVRLNQRRSDRSLPGDGKSEVIVRRPQRIPKTTKQGSE